MDLILPTKVVDNHKLAGEHFDDEMTLLCSRIHDDSTANSSSSSSCCSTVGFDYSNVNISHQKCNNSSILRDVAMLEHGGSWSCIKDRDDQRREEVVHVYQNMEEEMKQMETAAHPIDNDIVVVSSSSKKETVVAAKEIVVQPGFNIDDLHFLKILGEGQFGQVWLASSAATTSATSATEMDQQHLNQQGAPTLMAVKVLSKYQLISEGGSNDVIHNLQREIDILYDIHNDVDGAGTNTDNNRRQFVHPCLIQVIETIQDSNLIYIAQEFCAGGELFSLIRNINNNTNQMKKIEEEKLCPQLFYAACIADALNHLHSRGIIYRDLKPENIVIRHTTGYPVLIDFGFAKHLDVITNRKQHIGNNKNNSTKQTGSIDLSDIDYSALQQKQIQELNGTNHSQESNGTEFYTCASSIATENEHNGDPNWAEDSSCYCYISDEMHTWSIEKYNDTKFNCNEKEFKSCVLTESESESDNDNDNDNDEVEFEQRNRCYSMVGTPKYVAPEIILGGGYDYRADLWAYGVVLYELLAGYNPMEGPTTSETGCSMDEIELYRCITEEDYVPLPIGIKSNNEDAADLINQLLIRDPEHRIGSACDILNHAWFCDIDFDSLRKQQLIAPWIPSSSLLSSSIMDDNDIIQNTNTNNAAMYFENLDHISSNKETCIFKESYPKLSLKEQALFDTLNTRRNT